MYCHVFRVLHFHIFFLHFKLSCAIALKRWKRYDSGSFYRWADKNYGSTRIEVGVNPLCLFVTRTLTRFLNECYPGCSGCMPGRLAYRLPSFLLFHPLIFPRILLESRQKIRVSFCFFSCSKKKRQQLNRASNVGIVVRVSDPLFFSIKFHYSFEEMKKICQFFLPLFFFFSFPDKFQFLLSETSVLRYCE